MTTRDAAMQADPLKPLVQRIRPREMLLLMDMLTALLLVWYLSPAAKQLGRSMFFGGAFGLWLVLSFCADKHWLKGIKNCLLFLACWFLVYIGNYLFGRSVMFFEYLYVMVMFFAPALLFAFYSATGQTKKLGYFALFALAVVLVTAGTTLWGQLQYPTAARLISTGVKQYGVEQYSRMNIASYGFAYGLMLYLIVAAGFIRHRKHSWANIAMIALVIFLLAVMVKMEFTTSLLLVAAGIFVALFLNGRRATQVTIAVLLLLVVVIVFEQFVLDAATAMSNTMGSKVLRDRMLDLVNLLQGSRTGDINLRTNLYWVSIETAINNPLFGVGAYYGYDSTVHGVGGHAEIFDVLARFGLVGLVPLAGFYIAWFAYMRRQFMGNPMLGSIKVMQVFFLALSCINVIFNGSEIGVFLFFAIPALAYVKLPAERRAPIPPPTSCIVPEVDRI